MSTPTPTTSTSVRKVLVSALPPGLTVKEIAAKVDASETTVRSSLSKLESAGTVIGAPGDVGTRFMLTTLAPDPDAHRVINPRAGDARRRDEVVVLELQERGQLSLAQLERALTDAGLIPEVKAPERIVYGCLWRLRQAGRIEKVLTGERQPVYQVTPS